MQERADILRRRIAHYRRLLQEGAELELAQEYFRQMAADEAELAQIERDTDQRP